ncbi:MULTISPECIES: hypothetical protein [unclassified Iodidimonas]|jgi:hypothetical protein|uniref:hypothetical protein n=1 Tax=unclassified Iodidimonas TaxID=2626145 RepID=UPI00248300FE|nr:MULTISPECIES: hypothetical protein [unclassified Iodidimonas]
MAFFGFGTGGASPFQPQITAIDLSVLRFRPPIDIAQLQNSNRGPAVIPPWQIPQASQTLVSQFNDVRNLRSFIDENAPGVKSVGVGPDQRATFVAFDALTKLETLARFAAENSTPVSSLARLDAQFQQNLAEISAYIASAETDKLTLLSGTRASSVTSPFEMKSNSESFIGRTIATAGRDQPIPGIVGDEVFTLAITRLGVRTDLMIDLAQIDGPITVDSLVTFINERITSVQGTDQSGELIFTASGDPAPKFTSRFAVSTDANLDHGLRINTTLFEEVRLIPAVAEPSLFIASNKSALIGDDVVRTGITRFDQSDGTLVQKSTADIAGVDRLATAIASAEDDEATVAASTSSTAVAVDGDGFIYTLGTSTGDFGNQLNLAGAASDVVLTKMDSLGNVVFSRLLGSSTGAEAFSLAIDSQNNVVIAGSTADNIAPGAVISGIDSFVTKFSSRGDELFTFQVNSASEDRVQAITIDQDDNIIVSGFSRGALDVNNPSAGGRDAMLLKIDGSSGQRLDATLIGDQNDQQGNAVAIAGDGNILLASNEGGRVILRKVDANDFSSVLFEQDLGAIDRSGEISGLKVSGNDIFLVGSTDNGNFTGTAATVANASSGGREGFVLKLADQGASVSADFISFVGTLAFDEINDVALGGTEVFVTGTTRGNLEPNGRVGPRDGFVARIDMASGAITEVQQFGEMLTNVDASGIAFVNNGPSVLDRLGLPMGMVDRFVTRTIEDQTTARPGDFFEISINGGRRQRITLSEGDNLLDLARKINRLSFRDEVQADGRNNKLVIRATGTSQVDVFAGPAERDLLGKMGIEPQRLLGTTALFNLDDETSADARLGGVFAFNLRGPLGLSNKQQAAFTLTRIQESIETAKRAFRSLSPSPLDDLLNRPGGGTVPTRLQNQISNYNAALQRLQGGGIGGFGFTI